MTKLAQASEAAITISSIVMNLEDLISLIAGQTAGLRDMAAMQNRKQGPR